MSEYILRGNDSQPARGTSEAEEKMQGDPAAMVGPVAREMSEPSDGLAPTPVALLLLFFALAGWGGYYLSNSSGGFRSDTYDEHVIEAASQAAPMKPVDPMVFGPPNIQLLCTVPPGERQGYRRYLSSSGRLGDRRGRFSDPGPHSASWLTGRCYGCWNDLQPLYVF
jgi:hypothetical protein